MSYATQQTLNKVSDILDALNTAAGFTVTPKTLSPANDTVEAGLYEATTLSAVDTDLNADNIKAGVTIFGIAGAAGVQDIADADLTVAEAPTGKKFYAVSGGVKTGTGTKTLSAANDTVSAGYYAATTLSAVDADLASGNIKSGVTIFGVAGDSAVVDTTIAADFAIAGRLKTGDKAYTNGSLITGDGTKTLSDANDTVAAGYYEATTLSAVDTDLSAGNIKDGVTIFGVEGTFSSGGEVSATGTVTSDGLALPTDGDTVLIDAKTYTFKAALTTEPATVEGEVLIAGTAALSLQNLTDAINLAGTSAQYTCADHHPTVSASYDTLVITFAALTAGVTGNAIDLVATGATLTASAAHLAGGLTKAGAGQISSGYFAWVDGSKVVGSLA